MNSCQIRRVVAGTALLVATLSSCQRASYVFQRAAGAPHSGQATALAVPTPIVEDSRPEVAWPHQGRLGRVALQMGVHQRAGTVPVAKHRPVTAKAVARAKPWLTAAPPARQAEPDAPVRHRSRGLALLLALVPIFGLFGAHRFYLGYYGAGTAYLLGGLLGVTLLAIGVSIAAVGLLYGGSAAAAGYLVAGSIVLLGLATWAIVDAVRIATGQLLPKNGEYNPRWFQLRARANDSTANPSPK